MVCGLPAVPQWILDFLRANWGDEVGKLGLHPTTHSPNFPWLDPKFPRTQDWTILAPKARRSRGVP